MKRTLLFASLLVAVLLPLRNAHACGSGGYNLGPLPYVALGLAATDVAFSLHDLAVDKSSHGSGVAETLLIGPQAVGFGAWFVSAAHGSGSDRSNTMAFTGLMTLWLGALTAHGVYAIVNGEAPHMTRYDEGTAGGAQPDPARSQAPVEVKHPAAPPKPEVAFAPLVGPVFADPLASAMQDPMGRKLQPQNLGAQAMIRF